MDSLIVCTRDADLHVGVVGDGPDVVVLSGGPGCVHYLEDDALAPRGFRAWFPEPRGVGRSTGSPHSMAQAIADLEAIRESQGITRWIALGHSWGCDLALRYALDCPRSVEAVVGIAGTGAQRDRSWSAAYQLGKGSEPPIDVEFDADVHESLKASFIEWIHSVDLWRRFADTRVPLHLIAAGDDIRPSWPLEQIAALAPKGRCTTVPRVPHDFWHTDPDIWAATVTAACNDLVRRHD